MSTVSISQPPSLQLQLNITDETCNSSGSIDLTVSGGTPPYFYFWNNGATTEDISNLVGGQVYTVLVTDANMCNAVTSDMVQQATFNITVSETEVSCFGGSNGGLQLILNGTTPFTYDWQEGGTWTSGGTTISTVEFISNQSAGQYSVQIIDGNGCLKDSTFEITQPTELAGTISKTDVTCFQGSNGEVSIVANGGTPLYTYSWNAPGNPTTYSVPGLSAGTYTVTISDANSCTHTESVTVIEENSEITFSSIITGVSCNGLSDGAINPTVNINFGPSTNFMYFWSNGGVSEDISGLVAGTYTLNVTHNTSGCQESESFIVNEPDVLSTVINKTDEDCINFVGSVNAIPSGGTPAYSYFWDAPGNPISAYVGGLSVGTYSVTVTDFNGCQATASATINPPVMPVASLSGTDLLCKNIPTGEITTSVVSGTPPYSYLWNNAVTSSTNSNLNAGTFTVIISDSQNCTDTVSLTITEPATSTAVQLNYFPNICYGVNTGQITAVASGGTVAGSGTTAYTYQWSNGNNTFQNLGLTAGTYGVTVSDDNGCEVSQSATIVQPLDTLYINGTITTDVNCFGESNGALDITPQGGWGSYTYLWSNGQIVEDIQNLQSGTYSVTITDANNCIATSSYFVDQPNALTLGIPSTTNILCFGENTGAIDLSVVGGTTPYDYLWSNTETTQNIANLIANTYDVTVTDAHGCSSTINATLSEPASAVSVQLNYFPNICFGASTGNVTAIPTGGTYSGSGTPTDYNYLWSNGGNTFQISSLTAGTYEVTVSDDNGCTVSQQATINQPTDLLQISSSTIDDADCFGNSDGAIDITPFGGWGSYSFLWSNGAVSEDLINLISGNYTVTITDGVIGCTAIATYTVGQPSVLNLNIDSSTDILCNGDNSGDIYIGVAGGTFPYNYLWSNNSTTEDITNLIADTYEVTVSDANGCSETISTTLTEPASEVSVQLNYVANICYGASSGSITAIPSGGTISGTGIPLDYSYIWSNGGNTFQISGLTAGTYEVTVSDDNGCTVTQQATINQPTDLLVINNQSVTDANCFGESNGSINITSFGGWGLNSYLWSNAATTEDLINIPTGNYSVTVTDIVGCFVVGSYFVDEPTDLQLNFNSTTNILCNGNNTGSIDLGVNGGSPNYSYLWSNGEITEDINTLPAGNYSVTVSDSHGCSDIISTSITEPAAAISVQLNYMANICYGANTGSITAIPSGGTVPGAGTPTDYNYIWSNGSNTFQISGLVAGTYEVTVSDDNGCSVTQQATINQPLALLEISNSTVIDANCFGENTGSINISTNGGWGSNVFVWDNGSNAEDLINLTTGTYLVTVSDGLIGCFATGTYFVDEPTELVSSITSVTDILCNGENTGEIEHSVTGGSPGYTFFWSNFEITEDLSSVPAGNYSVTVTDSHGCTDISTTALTEPTTSISLQLNYFPYICYNANSGQITALPNGGTVVGNYTYAWSNGSTDFQILGLPANTYSVTVSDDNACTVTQSATIQEPASDLMILNDFVTNANCFGESNGAINITVDGGWGAYTYLWSNSSTTQNISGLNANTYDVVVSDLYGCTVSGSFIVDEPNLLEANFVSITDILCHGDNTGEINLGVIGGTTPYSYLWSNGETTEDINNLIANAYEVTVTDNNNCVTSVNGTLTEPATSVSVQLNLIPNICYGANTGSITAIPIGGTISGTGIPSDYTYTWSDGETSFINNALIAGTYTVTVFDDNACTDIESATILQPANDLIITNSATVDVQCYGESNGAIDITPFGGWNQYTYLWNNSSTDQDISNLPAGNYSVVVSDLYGCSITANYTIDQPNTLALLIQNTTNVSCNGESTGAINLGVSGGTSPFTYHWETSNGTYISSFEDLILLTADTYTVTVTDDNLCTATISATLSEPSAVNVSFNSALPITTNFEYYVCFGETNGNLIAQGMGGTAPYTYLWFDGSTDVNVTNIGAGTYLITVTDALGCEKVSSQGIIQSANAITPILTAFDPPCILNTTGEISLILNGGESPYLITWSTGQTSGGTFVSGTGTVDSIFNLNYGTYTISIEDSWGCTNSASAQISPPPDPITLGNLTGDIIQCFGESSTVSIEAMGGTPPYMYSFDYDTTNYTANVAQYANISAGVYPLSMWDANGCASVYSITIYEPDQMSFNSNIFNVSCFTFTDGIIDLSNVAGGFYPGFDAIQTYSYTWSNLMTTQDVTVGAGIYSVTITSDARGCTTTGSFTVDQPNPMSVLVIDETQISCNNSSDGAIDISVGGGTSPYSYLWTNGAVTQDLVGIPGNFVYDVTVTDANGCNVSSSAQLPITLIDPAPMTYSFDSTSVFNVLCAGDATGYVDIDPFGGAAPYTYQWMDGSLINPRSDLVQGDYTVTVTDINSCQLIFSLTIHGHDEILINSQISEPLCYGDANGSINLFISGGVFPFNATWTGDNGFSSNLEDLTNITAGMYSVIIEDSLGCFETTSIVLNQPCELSSTLYGTDSITGISGMIDNYVCCGTYPYIYLWNTNDVTEDLANIGSGTYTVTVTDNNGCQVSSSYSIYSLEAPHWYAPFTGNNHTIHIPINAVGLDIGIGDYLGVFYDSSGVPACGGYVRWEGSNTALSAWGDDGLTIEKDGFDDLETFTWRIWDVTNGYTYPAVATYDVSYQNIDAYEENGISGLLSIGFDPSSVDTQYIALNQNWNIISTYIDVLAPSDSVVNVFANIMSDLIIIKDGYGNIFAPYGLFGPFIIDGIGTIAIGEGYQVKMANTATLAVVGQEIIPENIVLSVPVGWSMLGYLRFSEASIDYIFMDTYNGGMNNVTNRISLVKNSMGQVYWPEINLNLIGNMVPGQGYQIKINTLGGAVNFSYPPNGYLSKSTIINQVPVHFKNVKNTGTNMTIGFPKSAWNVVPNSGDELGVFNANGVLVGSTVFSNTNLAVSVWGNDETTESIEGLMDNENMTFKLWNSSTNIEEVFFVESWEKGEETYSTNGISIAEKVSLVGNSHFSISQNVPNPFSDYSEIEFYLPESKFVTISIYNLIGDKLEEVVNNDFEAGNHKIKIDGKNLSAGTYYYKISTDAFVATKAMNIIK